MNYKLANAYHVICRIRGERPTWFGLGRYAGREAAKDTAREYFARCRDNNWTPRAEGLDGMYRLSESGHRAKWVS